MPSNIDPQDQSNVPASSNPERRQHPRLQLQTPMPAETRAGERVRIVNISKGGVMAESTAPFAVASRLTLAMAKGALTVSLPVRVVNFVRVTRDTETRYMLNMAFILALDDAELDLVSRWADREHLQS